MSPRHPRYVVLLIAVLFGLTIYNGCTKRTSSPAVDYESYQPPDGHWALELQDDGDVSEQTIVDTIEAVDGIRDGSIVVNTEAGYISFRPEDTDLVKGAAAKGAVIDALTELGVETGESKIIN